MTTYEEYAKNSRMDLDDCLIFAKLYFKEHCTYTLLDDYGNNIEYDISEEDLSIRLKNAINDYNVNDITLLACIECPLDFKAKISGGILA